MSMPQPDLFPASFLAAMITVVVVLVGYRITKRDQRLGIDDSWAIMFFMIVLCSSLFASMYFSDWIAEKHPNASTILHIVYGNLFCCMTVGILHSLRVGHISKPFERVFFTGLLFAFPIGAIWMLV